MNRIPLTFLCLLGFIYTPCIAQNNFVPYGGYVLTSKHALTNEAQYTFAVFYDSTTWAPDSMFVLLDAGSAGDSAVVIYSTETTLCNGTKKREYILNYDKGERIHPIAYFKGKDVRFTGKNVDTSLGINHFSLRGDPQLQTWKPFESVKYRDLGLVLIEKGKMQSINLIERFYNRHILLVFQLLQRQPIINPSSVSIKSFTGDMGIDARNLDTGLYAVQVVVSESYPLSTSSLLFTVAVVDTALPYYDNVTSKVDAEGIPFLTVKQEDTLVVYQINYIDRTGVSGTSFSLSSPYIFRRSPSLTSTQINDTTLRLSVVIPMDSISDLLLPNQTSFGEPANYFPMSMSLMSSKMNGGGCTSFLHSFYLTKDTSTSINETQVNQALITIYPNPALRSITLNKSIEGKAEVHIIDSRGRLAMLREFGTMVEVIDIQDLSSGVYFIQVYADGKKMASKKLFVSP
jgi:hypothetical protein